MNTQEKVMALIENQGTGSLYIELVTALGAQGAIFLSALIDWSNGDDWVQKTKAEWEQVTGFDTRTLRYAATRMSTHGIIQINQGNESYRINEAELLKVLRM